ncbi:MAG: hypothetical protein KDB14_30210 [Planctomycetales bacterium]|nr:hypothetical protein [Planctomycetales bacterium]
MSDVEFTPDARRVFRVALDDCLAVGDNYRGTQHILLALVTVAPRGSDRFESLNRAGVLEAIRETIGFMGPNVVIMGTPGCQTPRTRLIVEVASRNALQQGRPVTPDDLWSALLADPESRCRKVLEYLKVDVSELQKLFT